MEFCGWQVVTTDRTKYFREHANIESAIEHITELLNGTAPQNEKSKQLVRLPVSFSSFLFFVGGKIIQSFIVNNFFKIVLVYTKLYRIFVV